MGDVIELTTYPYQENVFYEVTSSAVSFHVKSARTTIVGLARKPGKVCDYWIVLSNHPYSYIKRGHDNRIRVRTPGILTPEAYKKFWIAWNGSFIRFGNSEDEHDPMISCANKVPGIRYVTFDITTGSERGPVDWKVELPPQLSRPDLIALHGGEPHWVRFENHLPMDAVIGGHENEVLYIIRAAHMGSITPGKYVPTLRLASLSWGGEVHTKQEFEVLCGFNCTWVPCYENRIPSNAVIAGYAEGSGREKLFVGRVYHENHLIPGKVQPSHKVCYVPYNNKEIPKTFFDILVVPHDAARVVNKTYIYGMECESGSESEEEDDSLADEDF